MRHGLSALGHAVGGSLMLRSGSNRRLAWVVAIIGPMVLAAGFVPLRSSVGLAGYLFGTLLFVVAAAVMGGPGPALATAAIAIPLGDYYFAPPYDSLVFDRRGDLFVFIGFIVVAVVAAILVDLLAGLASQQGALRRLATLVARGAQPDEVFAAVTEEAQRQLPVDFARMVRFDADNSITFVAASSMPNDGFPVGTKLSLDGDPDRKTITGRVLRTGRPARIDNFDDLPGPHTATARRLGMRSVLGAPIIVDGRLWGVMVVGTNAKRKLPADTEARLASFTELLATAIANAGSRTELAASRARVVAAADETRRRIERDLHDGTQQRLVSLAIELRAAEARVPAHLAEQRAAFSNAARGLAQTVEELQEISRGIHPAMLSKGGLKPAIKTLARRSAVPVDLDVQVDERLPQQVEVAAYYVVSEALANVDKYAHASFVRVDVHARDSVIEVAVRDDGVGGADPTRGSGLIGLKDRVEALRGTITIAGDVGKGTSVVARIPIDGQ